VDRLAVEEDSVGEGPAYGYTEQHAPTAPGAFALLPAMRAGVRTRVSAPCLAAGLAVRAEHDVDAVELGVDCGAIRAEVAAARLGPLQGAGRDRGGEGVGVVAQLVQLPCLAHRAGKAPDGLAGRLGRRLEAPLGEVGALLAVEALHR